MCILNGKTELQILRFLRSKFGHRAESSFRRKTVLAQRNDTTTIVCQCQSGAARQIIITRLNKLAFPSKKARKPGVSDFGILYPDFGSFWFWHFFLKHEVCCQYQPIGAGRPLTLNIGKKVSPK